MQNIMQPGCAPAATCTRANTVLRPACVRSLNSCTVQLLCDMSKDYCCLQAPLLPSPDTCGTTAGRHAVVRRHARCAMQPMLSEPSPFPSSKTPLPEGRLLRVPRRLVGQRTLRGTRLQPSRAGARSHWPPAPARRSAALHGRARACTAPPRAPPSRSRCELLEETERTQQSHVDFALILC